MTEGRMSGVVTAIVNEIDPAKGRLKLKYPWMGDEEPQSSWTRIATPMAGKERGMQFLPEIGDEVLVAFEHGDTQHPVVIGCLWSEETDTPPRTEKASQRVIKTVAEHTLEFDDTEGEEAIKLLFKGNYPGIEITKDAISIKFADDAPSIELSQNSISIKFSDDSKIELSAAELQIKNSTLININP